MNNEDRPVPCFSTDDNGFFWAHNAGPDMAETHVYDPWAMTIYEFDNNDTAVDGS